MFAVRPRSGPEGDEADAAMAANLPVPPMAEPGMGLTQALLQWGGLSAGTLARALALHRRQGGRLEDLLVARGMICPRRLCAVMGRLWGLPVLALDGAPPDARLVDRMGAAACLRLGVVPVRHKGGAVVLAVAHPADFAAAEFTARAAFGEVTMALAPAAEIAGAVLRLRGADLARAATRRVPLADSCRGWQRGKAAAVVGASLAVAAVGGVVAPGVAFAVLLGWTVATMLAGTALRVAALACAPVRGAPVAVGGPLPVISVLVALYREAGIAGRLVQRLERLDYPRGLLDVMLVVEQSDAQTRGALAAAALPPWMRVVVVPDGPVRTKPRALNYALGLCRGSIVGVYDAEDAPEPDQLRKVAARFRVAGPRVACLQGVLDFYNTGTNWMSRCFALEYAAWFRVVLPGLARMGLPVPLGGTTLFFRRDVLERVGAWDAWNVTEDADLGVRLARRGYVTELIDTVTYEESCCRPWPWVKQRSRWIKGYMMTLVVHMRRPGRLWRDLGARGFIGFLVLFVATLSQFLLAPVLWLCWLAPLGVLPGGSQGVPGWAMPLMLLAEAVNLAVAVVGRRRAGLKVSLGWVLVQHAYFLLASVAAYKALWELMRRPFYWDKTSHGVDDPTDEAAEKAVSASEVRPRPRAGAFRRPG